MPATEPVVHVLAMLGPMAAERPAVAAHAADTRRLVERATSPTEAEDTDAQVRAVLVDATQRLMAGGWRRADIERVIRRRCAGSDASVAVFSDVLVLLDGENGWWESGRWFEVSLVRSADPSMVVAAVAALAHVLTVLQPLPLFDPLDQSDLDNGVLRKVRALLAKAESTGFAEEADALTAKAQDLITRHALDGLDLDPEQRSSVTSRHLPLDPPYVSAKSVLLSRVAAANRCQTVHSRFSETAVVVGVPSDLAAVEVLYTSLLTQATSAMLAAGSVEDRSGRRRTTSFRRSFLLGFAQRVGVRLAEATSAAVESSASSSLVPALRARIDAVDDAMREAFPSTEVRRVEHSNGHGYGAGDQAGASADLGGPRVCGARGQLPA